MKKDTEKQTNIVKNRKGKLKTQKTAWWWCIICWIITYIYC